MTFAWFLADQTGASPLVTGTVTARNGTPLAEVQVKVGIRTVRTIPPSDTRGLFQFDAGALFSAEELRGPQVWLTLQFSKPGFSPVTKNVQLGSGQAVELKPVLLDPTGGSAALASSEKETLNKYAAAPGSAPLFLIPYSLSGMGGLDPSYVNEMLRANLERVIVTHLQASAVGGSAAVSLKLLPISQVTDIDRMRAYGDYLHALGVITGYGNVERAAGGPGTLGVSSTFLVIPQADSIGALVLYVDDDMPADRVASPRLYQNLSKLWGRSAVLAVGVGELRQAKANHDKKALERIRKYVTAERAGAGPGDEALVAQLTALIESVDKELAQ